MTTIKIGHEKPISYVPILGIKITFVFSMRVIAVKTLKKSMEAYPEATDAILSWYDEVKRAAWKNPNELKAQYRNASVLTGKRVVFNIHGNSYRLIVDIEFKFQILFVIWFGTHKDYDSINATSVQFTKTDPDE